MKAFSRFLVLLFSWKYIDGGCICSKGCPEESYTQWKKIVVVGKWKRNWKENSQKQANVFSKKKNLTSFLKVFFYRGILDAIILTKICTFLFSENERTKTKNFLIGQYYTDVRVFKTGNRGEHVEQVWWNEVDLSKYVFLSLYLKTFR